MVLSVCFVLCCLSGRPLCCVFFFKQKTAYELRISDWSSDVCSSDLRLVERLALDADLPAGLGLRRGADDAGRETDADAGGRLAVAAVADAQGSAEIAARLRQRRIGDDMGPGRRNGGRNGGGGEQGGERGAREESTCHGRSEEHTSEIP